MMRHSEKDQETWHTISFKKYVSPEEEQLKKKNKRLKVICVVSIIIAICVGWLGGSLLPLSNTTRMRLMLSGVRTLDADKISAAMQLMEEDWFFGSEIENLDQRLTDQAIEGITTNSEDPHTDYMSEEEMTSFTQSINRNYVGIGVQFINTNNTAIVEKVFKDSPAEKAGVQAGDIIANVDGTNVYGMTSDEIKELVQGDEGTTVTITFTRGDEDVTYKIERAALSATAFGKIMDDVGYLQLYQFGDGTPDEVSAYLEDFKDANITNLIIDLRDNGGGYLTSVEDIAGDFLPEDSLVMSQEYKNGEVSQVRTDHKTYYTYDNIVILVNENTASAAEVLTLALKQNLDNVTIVGKTTYGKGTVQITKQFSDGSALKFTTSKWLSPDGTWVNNVGISPDEEVYQDDVMYRAFTGMSEDETYQYDSVSDAVGDMQYCLAYLGYDIDRNDGYFSESTRQAIIAFAQTSTMESDGTLTYEMYSAIRSAVILEASTNDAHDNQLQKGLEVIHG